MKPTAIVMLALELTKLARSAVSQLTLADIEQLPPEIREQLLAERDQLNSDWAALAPQPAPDA